jgi:hypothetical protein
LKPEEPLKSLIHSDDDDDKLIGMGEVRNGYRILV